jgi:sugar/nucleoside kinase (ribokinase family)
MASAYSLFRVASFTSGEIREMGVSPVYDKVDLLALNLEELRQLVGLDVESRGQELKPAHALEKVCERYPQLLLTVTDGGRGSWSCDGNRLCHQPSVSAEVASTAGAGDAFLAGVISGLTAGLTLNEAQQLGTLTGALSVTSPHTIHRGIHRRSLSRFLRESGYGVSDSLLGLID